MNGIGRCFIVAMHPDSAAFIVAGHREAVDEETLNTAAKFAKYAIAAYGKFGLKYKDERGYG